LFFAIFALSGANIGYGKLGYDILLANGIALGTYENPQALQASASTITNPFFPSLS
jgi:hypothetical protein